MKLFSILCDANGNYKFKMAAYTKKILTSQLVYNVTANFQQLKYVFEVQDLNNAVLYIF